MSLYIATDFLIIARWEERGPLVGLTGVKFCSTNSNAGVKIITYPLQWHCFQSRSVTSLPSIVDLIA